MLDIIFLKDAKYMFVMFLSISSPKYLNTISECLFFKLYKQLIQMVADIVFDPGSIIFSVLSLRRFLGSKVTLFPYVPDRLVMPMGSFFILHKFFRCFGMSGMYLHCLVISYW